MPELETIWGCPFPSISSTGELRPGLTLEHPRICKTCRDRPCRSATPSSPGLSLKGAGISGTTCGRKVDYLVLEIDDDYIIVNGIDVRDQIHDKPRGIKKHLEPNMVSLHQLQRWRESLELLRAKQESDVADGTRAALEMFHDVQTAASSIVRSAERLVSTQPGRNDEERFLALAPAAQTLIKSAELLEMRLRSMPIVTNPAAASFGSKIHKPIYRIIDMLVRTLQPMASHRRINLRLTGSSRKSLPIYQSFDLLPLTLIENAIKYSAEGQSIEVDVHDSGSGIAVNVSSFSPWIDLLERQKMFERRFRASGARAVNAEGSGLGLYIAETVAIAHGTHVLHHSDDRDISIDGVRYCQNRFFFTFR